MMWFFDSRRKKKNLDETSNSEMSILSPYNEKKGSRQGCIISAILYIFVAEILSNENKMKMIRKRGLQLDILKM